MKAYNEDVRVFLSERDANTIRLALVNYASSLRSRGLPANELGKEALALSERLLVQCSTERDDAL